MALEINLDGQVALVTGASSGIGLGIARMMARAGCDVAGCGRRSGESEGARRFLEEVRKEDREALYRPCDVCDPGELTGLVGQTVDRFGGMDILVSNAGRNFFEGARHCSEAAWRENMDLNLAAHWRLGKRCCPHLTESTNGTIIIMNSNHAYSTLAGCFPYNVAKSALRGLVQSLAVEWGPGIRTVGIAPGFVDTPGNDRWFASFPDPEAERQRTINRHPAGKIASVEEIGAHCVFLASDYASFATGTTYLVDGGRSALMQDT